jgi:hypothetical protein
VYSIKTVLFSGKLYVMSSLTVTLSKIFLIATVYFLFVVLEAIKLATKNDLGSNCYESQLL